MLIVSVLCLGLWDVELVFLVLALIDLFGTAAFLFACLWVLSLPAFVLWDSVQQHVSSSYVPGTVLGMTEIKEQLTIHQGWKFCF